MSARILRYLWPIRGREAPETPQQGRGLREKSFLLSHPFMGNITYSGPDHPLNYTRFHLFYYIGLLDRDKSLPSGSFITECSLRRRRRCSSPAASAFVLFGSRWRDVGDFVSAFQRAQGRGSSFRSLLLACCSTRRK
ncbi:hypothetical protein J6590_047019 [Homalodisca vitripennis]|nr:hypothetical protein J6590_047019 [Homalodisca vitripennis]